MNYKNKQKKKNLNNKTHLNSKLESFRAHNTINISLIESNKVHFNPLNHWEINFHTHEKTMSIFWDNPSMRRSGHVCPTPLLQWTEKNLSIFMLQTSINVFYVWRRRVAVGGGQQLRDRYVRPFRAPTAYFTPPIRRELLWVGIKLLSYCLCDINNKKISNPAYFASCYCNKA